MKLSCPVCKSKSVIRTSQSITDTLRYLYLQCQNIPCSCSFKAVLSVDGIISPSGLTDEQKSERKRTQGATQ